MNIVVIDGYTLNPGDLSWKGIEQYGKLTVYERTPVADVVARCTHADIVLTNKVPFDKNAIDHLPRLKLISVTATGYNIIDVAAASEKGIMVCNVPAYGTASVAQHTFALILELTNHTGTHAHSVAQGEWETCKDFAYTKTPLMELAGKTLGIVGFGNIGRQVAHIASAFGMQVIYNSASRKDTAIAQYADLKTLFAESDIVSLHCPLRPDNYHFVNQSLLQLMKPSAFLINTARGQLINEQDLANSLNNGIIAGAGLDVLSAEPPPSSNPLLKAKSCTITPHIAWITKEARERIMDTTIKNIAAFLKGKVVNRVN
ncbi:D-2-hydroxyacid dehydrogenase [Ilyomonas limi]|uniref:D-2-hydroxyacid dehydrogenase n=1 Tax=Ilyomonas limi TaxID=2575867 RepID=A0A4U3L8C9_9BACT|nr:D-2-hydroxyacid dehydrogenase [Ilyomonas limi]TKK71541.1 D-2-hydroxyacid dehydrogenase [Ilyomonas limi]